MSGTTPGTAAPPPEAEPAPAALAGAPPATLALDIGGTGLKGSVLDAGGRLLADRVRVTTVYPCPPDLLVAMLVDMVKPLPPYHRVTAGFPGMIRAGRVLSAPHFVTQSGPGSKVLAYLVEAWGRFDLRSELEARLGKPTLLANDADVQGAAVVTGEGLEVVMTLGTGMGTAVFSNGRLAPHLELAHHPFRKKESYDEQLGDAARKRIGDKEWSARVHMAIDNIAALMFFDHLYIGGGNSGRLHGHLGDNVSLVDNIAGLVGGVRMWEQQGMTTASR